MAKLELRRFKEVTHLLIVAESEGESKIIDEAVGKAIPTPVHGEVTLADGYAEHYIRLMNFAECNHFRKFGPLGCLIENKGNTVGVWRWLVCENCHAFKQWNAENQTAEDVPWQEHQPMRKK